MFAARAQALSRADRVRMIEPGGRRRLSRQCVLLGVSRSSLYRRPKGERREDLTADASHARAARGVPFYGSRQMMRHFVGRLLQHPPSPLGPRLPGARDFERTQPCCVKRSAASATAAAATAFVTVLRSLPG